MPPHPAPTVPLVLIHGVSDTHRSWDPVVDELGDATVIRYDLRGHGEAPKRPLVSGIDDFVDDLLALLDTKAVATATTATGANFALCELYFRCFSRAGRKLFA